ncbi:MAG: hypothetical protein IMZ47_00780 [Firmicutes bacterium]|nr:hypothetical protein [Bacillota bacterium]
MIATILALILTVIALIATMLALIVSAIFYFTSARELRHIGKVIIDYLQMAMNNPDIKPKPGKGGIPENWNVTLHPGGIPSQAKVSDNVKVTEVLKKPD